MCARDGTRLFTPHNAAELETIKTWMNQRKELFRIDHRRPFSLLLGKFIKRFKIN